MQMPDADRAPDLTSQATLGQVISVRGSEARIGLYAGPAQEERRATVGKFVVIRAGGHRLIGVVGEISANIEGHLGARPYAAIAQIDLMGEIRSDEGGREQFKRGVTSYPAIGDAVEIIDREALGLIYSVSDGNSIAIGHLHHDASIPVIVDINDLLSKHFAILGSTGVGKSSGVSVILNEILAARPNLRLFLLDGHNEYGHCFGDRVNVITAATLKLPFWLFNFEEFIDVLFAGRPGADDEIEILSEQIPVAKGIYALQRLSGAERHGVRRPDPRHQGFTVDTPSPYLLQDLIGLIDERMGKLENRTTRMSYHRLLARIDTMRNDPRYSFMFDNANVGGDTMVDLLCHLFRLEAEGKPMTVMQVGGLPAEVIDAVVCVLCRLVFDFGLWSEGRIPVLFVCEEAHRYASADRSVSFAPTRRALMRIAKEGRKYGVHLGLVTQRPGELDATIISQCNTLFAMRLPNERDQELLRSAVTDAAANLLAFVPSLATREAVGFGEGMPLPARFTFSALPESRVPRGDAADLLLMQDEEIPGKAFVRSVVERWRGAKSASEGASIAPEPAPAGSSPVANRIETIRSKLLHRSN